MLARYHPAPWGKGAWIEPFGPRRSDRRCLGGGNGRHPAPDLGSFDPGAVSPVPAI